MKTFAAILILGTVFFVKSTSSAADALRVSPSPIELVMDCGTVYTSRITSDKFDSSVEFREATKLSMEVTFRNIGEFFVSPEILTSGVSIVWDGKEYKQKPKQPSNSASLGALWPPKSCYRDHFLLSDFVMPPEALTSGQHTVAVKMEFPEKNTFLLPATGIPNVVSSDPKLTVLPIAQSNSNRQIYAESSALTIFIKTPK